MKGTISFNLPEENCEFKLAAHAGIIYSVLWEVCMYLRNKKKHGNLTNKEYDIYDEIHKKIYEELESHGVLDHFFE